MRYARGWGEVESRWAPLAVLLVDKVVVQKDILGNQLGKSEITEIGRQGIRQELDSVNKRWESGRSQNAVGAEKRPVLTSEERIDIQVEKRIGWDEWQEMDRAHQWECLGDLGLLRRRPVRNVTEELGGNQDIPKHMGVFPECQGDEEERSVRKLNRRKRPKLTTSEIEKLQNCDRPLNKDEWAEMSIGRHWGTLEMVGILKKEPTEEEKDVEIAAIPITSPKKPPKAPFGMKAFATEPSSSSRNCLGGQDAKGRDREGEEIPKEDKWEDSKGTDSKGKGLKGKSDSDNAEDTGEAAGSHYTSHSARGRR